MAWSALLTAAAAVAFAQPAYADPPLPRAIPDTGARPMPAGAVQLPGAPANVGGPAGVALTASGPLAAEIFAKEVEVATLGEQLLKLRLDQEKARDDLAVADQDLQQAREALARAEQLADQAVADALKDAAGLPPGAFGTDVHGLGALSRLQRGAPAGSDTNAAARELTRARAVQLTAEQAYVAADAALQTLVAQYTQQEATYKQRESALVLLKQQNVAQLAVIEQQREAGEQLLGASFIGTDTVAGRVAHARALAAVSYALAQRGKPYLWAAEGPDRFDCSGLMWAAYRSRGADYNGLPRVSRDQYYATRGRMVSPSSLLPGDLLFFASDRSDWTSIHHVGMYIGGGMMVHAPTTGDVVKVSTVWWSRFYAATRVIGEVPGPAMPIFIGPVAPTTPRTTPGTTPPATRPPATTPPATTPPSTTRPTTPPSTTRPTTPPSTTTPTTPPPATTPPSTPGPTPTAPTSPDPTTTAPSPAPSETAPTSPATTKTTAPAATTTTAPATTGTTAPSTSETKAPSTSETTASTTTKAPSSTEATSTESTAPTSSATTTSGG